ncbi:hypothetical protein [Amaricoccus sp.]|uniref:hypothetical protein n=1 Tax=Amaricoccus sp. TaxID=1872485 RepID=UPI001B739763|nr:hypothetical protein [Amaricoccus sp.]MBP7000666.1 hypothetical protein [Amaricoccus sp.]
MISRHPAWLEPGESGLRANWISPFVFPDGEAAAAPLGDRDVVYTYSRTFDRPAGAMTIAWASDNAAVLRLNGRVLDSADDWGFLNPRRLTVGLAGLLDADNLLEVEVVNLACDCANPTGLLVNVAPVPLPAASGVMVTGLAFLAMAARRRRPSGSRQE